MSTSDETRRFETDVCVVGAGPAGLTVAGELARAGIRVTVVESGGHSPEEATRELAGGKLVGYPYYSLKEARERGIGGSSLAWFDQIRVRPLDPLDFHRRSWVPHSGWPFGLEHLLPYYERAHRVLGLGRFEYSLDYWTKGRDDAILTIPGFETELFQFEKGRKASESIVDIANSEEIRLFANSTVTELITDPEGTRISSIRIATLPGQSFELEARVFVLAAGGIDNPRLLLMSNKRWPSGIGNTYDLVGRFFQEHPGVHSGMLYPSDPSLLERIDLYRPRTVDGTRIRGALRVSDELQEREGLLNCAILLQTTDDIHASDVYGSLAALSWRGFRPGRWPLGFYAEDVKNVITNPLRAASAILGALNDRYPSRQRILELDMDSEQTPNPASRVTLGHERDPLGLPRPKLDWKFTEQDARSFRRTQEILRDGLRQAGLGDLRHLLGEEQPPKRIYGQRHHIGTTKMNPDPKHGVVDEHARVHGVQNLYIAGSSVFPSSGFANPTLTIVALSLRLADRIRATLFSG